MSRKSGKYWVTWANAHAKNSARLEDLDPVFRRSVESFVKELRRAGATVKITATRRSKKRAYLFHWSWKIATGRAKASDARKMPGVDIDWDHGSERESRSAAREMTQGFGLAMPPRSTNPPSLTSNHIAGKAVDMIIRWSGEIELEKKDGRKVAVQYMSNVNANRELHAIGASYGVKKLRTDAPHWSYNGR
jgi:hypothetical protein